ncbi:MAG: helix-turn-helix transcriptional regulator [Sandarakinorhabdus sp.]|nr:helix-turn-helix transcriptional regulator [Sandarakinorhabdus sp.]
MRVDFADQIETGFARNRANQLAPDDAQGLDNDVPARWCISVTTRQNLDSATLIALTEGQRDCLRLVYNHMKSKDIARILGLSPHTVDMRLRTAMRTLGVTSRIEAARMLVQKESGGETTPDTYQPLIYQAPDVAVTADPATMQSPALDGGSETGSPIYSDSRSETAFSPGIDPLVNGPPRLTIASVDVETSFDTKKAGAGSIDPESSIRPTVSPGTRSLPYGQRNDLSVGARLGWIFMIAVGSALAFGSILTALAALKSLI